MQNSLSHILHIWIHENESHQRGLEAIQMLVDSGEIPGYQLKVLAIDSPFTKKKIRALLHPYIKREPQVVESSDEKPKRKEYGGYSVKSFPEDLQRKDEAKKMLYEMMSRLRGDLLSVHYTRSGRHRKNPRIEYARSISFEILDVDDKIAQIWKELDYWKEHKSYLPGTTPKEMPNELKIAANLLEEQVNAVNYIRKQETYRRKNGMLQNPQKYRECKETLSEIKKFIEKHG